MDLGIALVGLVMGVGVALLYARASGRRVVFRVGNLLNALIYVAGALLLRTVGLPALYAYLWPLPVVAIVWLIARRERRIS